MRADNFAARPGVGEFGGLQWRHAVLRTIKRLSLTPNGSDSPNYRRYRALNLR